MCASVGSMFAHQCHSPHCRILCCEVSSASELTKRCFHWSPENIWKRASAQRHSGICRRELVWTGSSETTCYWSGCIHSHPGPLKEPPHSLPSSHWKPCWGRRRQAEILQEKKCPARTFALQICGRKMDFYASCSAAGLTGWGCYEHAHCVFLVD